MERPSELEEDLSNEILAQVMKRDECWRRLRVERILDEALQMQAKKKEVGCLEETLMIFILWALVRFGGGTQEEWESGYKVVSLKRS